jgi:hypothetical protein
MIPKIKLRIVMCCHNCDFLYSTDLISVDPYEHTGVCKLADNRKLDGSTKAGIPDWCPLPDAPAGAAS